MVNNANGASDFATGMASSMSRPTMPILLQYWNIFWRRRLIVVAILATCIVAAMVITGLRTPLFTAISRIEIARDQARVTNVASLESDRAGQTQEFYSTQYELLKARSLAERVVRRAGLARSSEFFQLYSVELEDADAGAARAGLATGEVKKRENQAIGLLMANVRIEPVRGSSLVNIGFTSPDPVWSARLANVWTEEFIQASLDRRFASTAQARAFLESRLADLRQRLDQSERELVDYSVSRNIIRLSETRDSQGGTATVQTLTGVNLEALNKELATATVERIRAQSDMESLARRLDSQRTIDQAATGHMRARRAELSGQLAAMLVQFEADYPPAKALQQQIEAIDRSISVEQRRATSAATGEFEAARARELALRQRVDAVIGNLSTEERNRIQFGILQREVDTNRQLYDGLLQRFKEIGIAGVGANNIAIVDPAVPPQAPSSPNLLINLIVASMLGLALAGGIVLIVENLDQGIRDPQVVQQQLGLPLLGAIPDAPDDDPVAALADPKSMLNEAYTTVISNLAFSTDHGVPRILMLTSSMQAEGKSTTAIALAIGLARAGKKVVLVDADMRLPTIDKRIGMRGTAGLSNYLAGDDNIAAMLHSMPDELFHVVTSGPVPPSAPDLLHGDRLTKLGAYLIQHFDHVIFDAPPLLGLADASLLAQAVEGVVFVVQAEREPVRAIAAAIERLRRSNARILGLVLTRYSASRSGYGYNYAYSYAYRYGEQDEGLDPSTAVGGR